MKIEVTHTFPVPVSEAFAYITAMENWEDYWPGFIRIQNPADAAWSKPGDAVTVVVRLMGREVDLNMRLSQFQQDRLVTYVSRQSGLADAQHERHFKAISGGFEYRLVVSYEARKGLAGILDRTIVKRSVERALHSTIHNLDAVFKPEQARA